MRCRQMGGGADEGCGGLGKEVVLIGGLHITSRVLLLLVVGMVLCCAR